VIVISWNVVVIKKRRDITFATQHSIKHNTLQLS